MGENTKPEKVSYGISLDKTFDKELTRLAAKLGLDDKINVFGKAFWLYKEAVDSGATIVRLIKQEGCVEHIVGEVKL